MKLESITVENYRQFEKAELTFDEGITILAGANNSGKTSLITIINHCIFLKMLFLDRILITYIIIKHIYMDYLRLLDH